MASDEIISLDCKLYYSATLFDGATSDAAAVTWVEIDNVSDVAFSLTREEADGTTRGNGGMKKTVTTLGDLELTFTLDADVSKAWFTAIKTGYVSRTPVPFAIMDGDETAAGADGPAANFKITNFSRSEPLNGVATYEVTAKIHEYFEWYTSV